MNADIYGHNTTKLKNSIWRYGFSIQWRGKHK